ncbi:MAG: serine/threonine-protein kinase [Simkaniaceae bacterium]|nr:serine/threonine-protein kinase [Simkaniaceae bacterium]
MDALSTPLTYKPFTFSTESLQVGAIKWGDLEEITTFVNSHLHDESRHYSAAESRLPVDIFFLERHVCVVIKTLGDFAGAQCFPLLLYRFDRKTGKQTIVIGKMPVNGFVDKEALEDIERGDKVIRAAGSEYHVKPHKGLYRFGLYTQLAMQKWYRGGDALTYFSESVRTLPIGQVMDAFKAYSETVLLGVVACHEAGHAHGDARPENVFVEGKSSSFKLGDFSRKKEGPYPAEVIQGDTLYTVAELAQVFLTLGPTEEDLKDPRGIETHNLLKGIFARCIEMINKAAKNPRIWAMIDFGLLAKQGNSDRSFVAHVCKAAGNIGTVGAEFLKNLNSKIQAVKGGVSPTTVTSAKVYDVYTLCPSFITLEEAKAHHHSTTKTEGFSI